MAAPAQEEAEEEQQASSENRWGPHARILSRQPPRYNRPMPDLWWWNFGVPAAMAGLYLLKILSGRYDRLALWEKTAMACRGGEVKVSSYLTRLKVTAQSGPNQVRITSARMSEDVIVEIQGPEGFSALKLRYQLFRSPAREIVIGDEPFDDRFVLEGPPLAVGARLDKDLRQQLLDAASKCSSLEIGDGRLRAEVAEKDLRRTLSLLLSVGRRLDEPVDVERKVAGNARRDPLAGVRLFNLLLLARERPGAPDTLDVLRGACSDESAEVRLRAAIELGDEGRDDLLKLTETLEDDEATAQAVVQLGRTLSFERLEEILDRAGKVGFLQTARAAARALGATGDAAAEPLLLQALQSEDDDLREAAATALGQTGTVAAVPALQEAAEGSWLALGVRRAARQSIAEIQSRLTGASPGQLSLAGADGEMGRLSLASADAGQLALAPEAAGELAILPHGAETEGAPADKIPSQRDRVGT